MKTLRSEALHQFRNNDSFAFTERDIEKLFEKLLDKFEDLTEKSWMWMMLICIRDLL